MPFNSDALYIQKAVGNIQHTSTPSGQIAIERALDGVSDFWISPLLPREKKQKNLIVSDWTAPYWSDEKRTKLIGYLHQFLQEGFHLYVWSNRTLTRLTRANIQNAFKKEACMSIKPASPDDIYAVALAQQNIPADQVYLFDDYQIESLYQDSDTIPYSIYVSHLVPCNQSDIEKIITISRKKDPNLSIIHDVFDASSNTLVSQLREKHPDVNIQAKYQSCVFSNETAKEFFTAQATGTTGAIVTLNGCSLTAAQLPSIKNLLLDIFKEECFFSYVNWDNWVSSLEVITLPHSFITPDYLIRLLQGALELKKISLQGSQEIKPGCLARIIKEIPNAFENLEEIDLHNTLINEQDVFTLCKTASNLKKISLKGSRALAPGCLARIIKEIPNAFEKLEEIDLRKTRIDEQDVFELCETASNLKKINLSLCQEELKPGCLARIINNSPNAFKNFEEIDLQDTRINEQDVLKLCETASNLKKINLSWCQEELKPGCLERTIKKIPNAFKKLEEIDLHNTLINEQDVFTLCKTASNLKKINLSGCKKLKSGCLAQIITEIPNAFENLEEIDLQNTLINEQDVLKLCETASNLKKINLSWCQELKPGCLERTIKKIPTAFKSLEEMIHCNTFGHSVKLLN